MKATAHSRAAAAAILALALAVFAAYADSFSGAFVYDDVSAIVENPTLRPPFRPGAVLFPPGDRAGTVGGRPLVNLSLALNFALGGTRPWGYHALNALIHAAAALALFGVVRRTLRDGLRRPDPESAGLGFAAALLWALHPLQTEAVTYVVQRAESLMGLFYLMTLYAFIRGVTDWPRTRPGGTAGDRFRSGFARRSASLWFGISWLACLLGMATKEVMATAPLIVFLYDRTFVSGNFREAWRRRWKLHLALAATWIPLAFLVAETRGRGGSAGFGSSAAWWPYVWTQCRAVVLYLRLALWPRPLVFDYGTALVPGPAAVAGSICVLAALLAATAWALVRRPVLGFAGAWFFVILAPSSSVLPIATEPIAEHRMYLPLAALAVLAAAAARRAWTRWAPRRAAAGFWATIGIAAACLAASSAARNLDYRSAVSLWEDTAAKAPDNPRALNDLGTALDAEGDRAGAAAKFEAAVRLDPAYAPGQYDLGVTLLDAGRPAEALEHFRRALSAPEHRAELRLYMGEALEKLGRYDEAAARDREAARLDPGSLKAAFALGNALAEEGRYGEAADAFARAVAIAPDQVMPRNNLANALLCAGRVDEAIAEYREVLRLDPGNPAARANLDLALRTRAAR